MMKEMSRKTITSPMEKFSRWIEDDEEIKTSGFEYRDAAIQVFVDFHPLWFGRLEIKTIDFLDAEYEPLKNEYTRRLYCYIMAETDHYNRSRQVYADGWDIWEETAREKYYQEKYGG